MQTIALTANFTAEPIEEPLTFWMNQLDTPCAVQFAPYNQVFQQLLDPASLVSTNQNGLNVVLIRLEDWWTGVPGSLNGSGSPQKAQSHVESSALELVEALKFAAENSRSPYLLCFCPTSATLRADPGVSGFLNEVETRIAGSLQDTSGIFTVTSAELLALYPVPNCDDLRANSVSHVPYTREFFQALGTLIARRFYRIHTPPHKVLVLDCDNTLWQGICGEDGPLAVQVEPAFRALQQFAIAQRDAGMLVCLCSKNNEQDVWPVFEGNPGMRLKREHLASSRINWLPKSQNLQSLSAELQLGLDSFIFLDDSAIECAEVESGCPEALVLQLPERTSDFSRFLSHVWAFDHLKLTAEDRRRSELYGQDAGRKQLLAESGRLEDFLAGLELQMEIRPMSGPELPRVAQLTQRTNQFNFTGIRRTESEVARLCSAENLECLVVQLRDRFGDYGLVGGILYTRRAGLLDVENVLLSCRALGRRVEHRMLAHLGQLAREEGRETIRIHFTATPKNIPAREFLQSILEKSMHGNCSSEIGKACAMDFAPARLANLSSSFCGQLAANAAGFGGAQASVQAS